jgi:hypothetical protein
MLPVSRQELKLLWVPSLKGLTPSSLLSSSHWFHQLHQTAV